MISFLFHTFIALILANYGGKEVHKHGWKKFQYYPVRILFFGIFIALLIHGIELIRDLI